MERMAPEQLKSDSRWFELLFESSPDPTWIIEGNRFVECNDAAIRTLGYSSRTEFLNVHPSRLSPERQPDGEDSYAKAERMMATARERGLHRFEWVHTRADGSDFWAEVTLSSLELGRRQVIYCVWRDISERKRTEEALRRQNETLTTLIDNFPGAISLFDADLRLAAHNPRFRRLLDLPDELFAKGDLTFEELVRYNAARGDYGAGNVDRQVAEILTLALECEPYRMERTRPDGTVLEITGVPLPRSGFVVIYNDITERRRMEDQIRHLAFYDPLTQLPNRRLFDDRLSQSMAASRRSRAYGALMFLDLDNFKPLNDTHGHVVGDGLLVEAAQRIRGCIREVDTVARFGGDEFVVLLDELSPSQEESTGLATVVAEKIRSRLGQPYRLTVHREGAADATIEHRCTASIGVALFINHESSADDLLKWADTAMYQAKEAGRDRIGFYATPVR